MSSFTALCLQISGVFSIITLFVWMMYVSLNFFHCLIWSSLILVWNVGILLYMQFFGVHGSIETQLYLSSMVEIYPQFYIKYCILHLIGKKFFSQAMGQLPLLSPKPSSKCRMIRTRPMQCRPFSCLLLLLLISRPQSRFLLIDLRSIGIRLLPPSNSLGAWNISLDVPVTLPMAEVLSLFSNSDFVLLHWE